MSYPRAFITKLAQRTTVYQPHSQGIQRHTVRHWNGERYIKFPLKQLSIVDSANSNTRYYIDIQEQTGFSTKSAQYLRLCAQLCKKESESIEHLLLKCEYSAGFWRELINWLNTIEIKSKHCQTMTKCLDFGTDKQIFIFSTIC